MSSEELKPCPFCGGKARYLERHPGFNPAKVICDACRISLEGHSCVEAWNHRAQLAAIQGGMGEVVEVVAWRIEHPVSQWKVYEQRQDWAYQQYGHIKYQVQDLMTVAQHQRITAAMAAEVERLREDYDKAWRHAGMNLENLGKALADNTKLRAELAAYKAISPYRIRRLKAVTKERDALRAELAEVKGREAVPVAIANKGDCAFWVSWTEAGKPLRGPGIKLYTTPPASPDVEGLVKALERLKSYVENNLSSEYPTGVDVNSQEFIEADTALSTWRQSHP